MPDVRRLQRAAQAAIDCRMAAPTTPTEALTQALLGPKKVTGDEGSVEQYSIQDLIAGRRALTTDDTVARPHRGIRFTRIVPPGAV